MHPEGSYSLATTVYNHMSDVSMFLKAVVINTTSFAIQDIRYFVLCKRLFDACFSFWILNGGEEVRNITIPSNIRFVDASSLRISET